MQSRESIRNIYKTPTAYGAQRGLNTAINANYFYKPSTPATDEQQIDNHQFSLGMGQHDMMIEDDQILIEGDESSEPSP